MLRQDLEEQLQSDTQLVNSMRASERDDLDFISQFLAELPAGDTSFSVSISVYFFAYSINR